MLWDSAGKKREDFSMTFPVFFFEKSKIKKRWAANAGRCFLFGPLDHPYGLVSTYGSLLGVIFLMMKKLRPWSLRQQQIGRTRLGRNGGNKTPSHLGQKMHQNAIFWSFKVKFLGVYLFSVRYTINSLNLKMMVWKMTFRIPGVYSQVPC